MAKTPTTKKAPVNKNGPTKGGAGRPAGLFTWLAIGLVVVVVATLVVIKVTSSSSPSGSSTFQPVDATTFANLTHVPASVFDTVGIKSPVAPVTPPGVAKNLPALTGTSSTNTTLPEVFYMGAEYCPFCAAERWPTIIALSRFGTWSGLGYAKSSTVSGEVFPGTPSFTFLKATYKSKYLAFRGIESYNAVYNSVTGFYSPLMTPTAAENALFKKYDTSTYIPGLPASNDGSIPFISIGNKYLVSGASYTPQALAGLTQAQIASGLSDPTSPVTDAIITSANYQTATYCLLTKNQPGSVCDSAGVLAAKKAMGIK